MYLLIGIQPGMTLLSACALSAVAAALLIGAAFVTTTHTAARIVLAVVLILGEVLPVALLILAWTRVRYIIPFLGPPVRINMLPVWWAIAAVVLSYIAATVDTVRNHRPAAAACFPPAHAVIALRHLAASKPHGR